MRRRGEEASGGVANAPRFGVVAAWRRAVGKGGVMVESVESVEDERRRGGRRRHRRASRRWLHLHLHSFLFFSSSACSALPSCPRATALCPLTLCCASYALLLCIYLLTWRDHYFLLRRAAAEAKRES